MDWKQWVELIGSILGILAALFTIPPIIFKWVRGWWNERESRTRKSATKRLARLEKQLAYWKEPSPIDKFQALAYSFVLFSVAALSIAFTAFTFYVNIRFGDESVEANKVLAVSIAFGLIAVVVSFWSGNYFTKYWPWIRESRVKEVEAQIQYVRLILMKLALKDAPLIEVKSPGPESPIPPSSTPKLP
jgi:Na+/melibiose symporter-like transporter